MKRDFLKNLGIEDSVIDQILDENSRDIGREKQKAETTKADLSDAQGKLAAAQEEITALKKQDSAGWQKKAGDWEKMYNDLVSANTAKEAKAAKESAARAYYESKGITGKALDIAMRGSSAEIESLELKDGKIQDAAALDALINGDFSGLVGQTHTQGANTAMPPANTGGKPEANTLAAQLYTAYHSNLFGGEQK